jgi:hypothetical protein
VGYNFSRQTIGEFRLLALLASSAAVAREHYIKPQR